MSAAVNPRLSADRFLTFSLGSESCGIRVLAVQEIIRLPAVTPVPQLPDCWRGLINLRGRIIPVLDLRRRFGLPASDRTDDSRIMVVLVRQRMVGLIVDEVVEVLRVSKAAIEPPPSVGSSAGAEFTQGVGRIEDRLLIVLDLNRLLLPAEESAMASAMN